MLVLVVLKPTFFVFFARSEFSQPPVPTTCCSMQEEDINEFQRVLEEELLLVEELQDIRRQNTSGGASLETLSTSAFWPASGPPLTLSPAHGPTGSTGSLKTLESSMKKNQALIRKLKTLSEASAPGVLADLKKLNHSKYISEAVSAIVEAPLKMRDLRVPAVLGVLSWLHRCYPDFEAIMFGRLMDELTGSSGLLSVTRKRILCRLFFVCAQMGIFPASNVRYMACDKLFRSMTADKLLPGCEASLQSLQLVNAFLKSGGPGLYPRICVYKNEMHLRELAGKGDAGAKACVDEVERINVMKVEMWSLSESDEQKMRMKIQAYVEGALKALEAWWKKVQQTKKSNDTVIQSRGDISEKRHQEFKEMCDALDAFQTSVGSLAATLRVSLPKYVIEEDADTEEKGAVHVVEPTRIFEDAEERAMYMALPQLAEVVPSTLLGAVADEESHRFVDDVGVADGIQDVEDTEDIEDMEDMEESRGLNAADEDCAVDDVGDAAAGLAGGPASASSSLAELISRLPECVTMEECDAFSVQYCYVGGRKASSQKALALALSRPPHGAIQLLPFYSRIIASLSPYFPLIKEEILDKLQRQFFGLKNVVDISTDTLEPRLRNANYIAELVKFGVYPPGKAFLQLRSLFDDFARQNIDTACCLVENCGNYLYKRPDTSERMVNMMNIILKLKDAKNLESRHEELISQARASMYGVETRVQRKLRSPVHEFVRHQIYAQLSQTTISQVAGNLRRVHWQNESEYIRKKILCAVRKGKESQLVPLASLVLELQWYDRRFGINVVDEVVEELYYGMENPEVSHYHRRLSMARFLGASAHVGMPGVDNEMLVGMMRTFLTYNALAGPNGSSVIASHGQGVEQYGEILEPMFRVRLVVGLCAEAKSLYWKKGKKVREEQVQALRQRRAIKARLVPYLEEFIMRYKKYTASTIGSHSMDSLVDSMYVTCKLGKRPKFDTYEDAARNLVAAMAHAGDGHEDLPGQADDDADDAEDLDDGEINADDADDVEDTDSDAPVDRSNADSPGPCSEEGQGMMDRADGPSQEELLFERELAMAMGAQSSSAATAAASISSGGPKVLNARLRDDVDADEDMLRPNKLTFKVVTKRGGRDDKSKRTVQIPVSSSLVERVAKKKQAEAEEKAALKRIVLASSNM